MSIKNARQISHFIRVAISTEKQRILMIYNQVYLSIVHIFKPFIFWLRFGKAKLQKHCIALHLGYCLAHGHGKASPNINEFMG